MTTLKRNKKAKLKANMDLNPLSKWTNWKSKSENYQGNILTDAVSAPPITAVIFCYLLYVVVQSFLINYERITAKRDRFIQKLDSSIFFVYPPPHFRLIKSRKIQIYKLIHIFFQLE